jgi:hypothetical protein
MSFPFLPAPGSDRPTPQVNIYGTPESDVIYYGALNKTTGQQITATDWRTVEVAVNQERVRRGVPPNAVISTRFQGLVEAADLNYLKTSVEVQGVAPNPPAYTRTGTGGTTERPTLETVFFVQAAAFIGGFQGVDPNREILAEEINAMVDKINGAGAVCVCNCNYCTCNCNYCTCNCNYSCTCNCNYSDIRLKTNIEFLYSVDELKVYKFSYKWDREKIYVGVMAQDVLNTKYKDAVIEDDEGNYLVNYSKLPIELTEKVRSIAWH